MNTLREYIAEVLHQKYTTDRKKLCIFDFDDTLVKTGSIIHVTNSLGEKFDLTPGEFAIYTAQQGDQFDFSDFSKLIDPKEIKWTVNILRNIIKTNSEVVILTARSVDGPVHEFLQNAGIPSIEVIALGDSNPQKKSDYIKKRIEEDKFNFIEFFDDSYKNIAAVESLKILFPDVTIKTKHIVHRTVIS